MNEEKYLCIAISLVLAPLIFRGLAKYKGPKCSWPMFIFVYLNVCLQMSAFVVLPLDIIMAHKYKHDIDGEAAMLTFWNFYYWMSFFSTLIVLPFSMYYLQSGQFTPEKKIKEATKTLIIWTIIPAIVAIVFWLYLLLFTDKLKFKETPKTVIALTNAYGSLILISALSYGLTFMPRKVWQRRDLRVILGFHYFKVVKNKDALRDVFFELETQFAVFRHIEKTINDKNEYLDARVRLLEEMEKEFPQGLIKQLEKSVRSNSDHLKSKFYGKPDYTEDILAEFNACLKAAVADYEMCVHIAETNMIDAHYYSNIKFSIAERDSLAANEFNKYKDRETIFKIIPSFEYTWYRWIHTPWSILKLCLYIVFSAIVFVGELMMYHKFEIITKFLNQLLFFQGTTQVYTVFAVTSVIFGYMVLVCAYSIFSLKISGFYGFYQKQTDPVTFLSFVFYMAKLTYPLCYSILYVMLQGTGTYQRTSFFLSIGDLSTAPVLGVQVPKYLPGLFIFLTIFFTFDCFNKVLSWLGFKVYQFSVETNCATTVEGRMILEKERTVLLEELKGREEPDDISDTRSILSTSLSTPLTRDSPK